VSFQLELEHLISHEVPRSTILSDAAGTDIPSLCAFLEILLGNGPEYDFDGIDYNNLPRMWCMCYHIDDKVQPEEVPGHTPPGQSPRSHVAYL
jgi:hypothetical protein